MKTDKDVKKHWYLIVFQSGTETMSAWSGNVEKNVTLEIVDNSREYLAKISDTAEKAVFSGCHYLGYMSENTAMGSKR